MTNLKAFTNLYSLSKTLRFELKPIGKTVDHLNEKGMIQKDEERAESYQKVKKIIDRFHKKFIDQHLMGSEIEDIDLYENLYFKANKEDKDKKLLETLQKKMRKTIAEQFTKSDEYKRLFAKELIKQDLFEVAEDEIEYDLIKEFDSFTTYFTGFHENRKNMYSSDEKSTAIAYRLIHENLPKFLNNKRIFDKIKVNYPEIIEKTKKSIEPYLEGISIENMFQYSFFNQTLRQNDIEIYNLMLGGKSDENGKIQGLNEHINLFRQKNNKTKRDIPNLVVLFKQILSDRDTFSFQLDKFEKPQDVLDSIKAFYIDEVIFYRNLEEKYNVIEKLKECFENHRQYDKTKIFLKNDTTLTDLSKQIFDDWSVISNALKEDFYRQNPKLKPNENNDKKFENVKFHSIEEIAYAVGLYCKDKDNLKHIDTEDIIFKYFVEFKKKGDNLGFDESIKLNYENAETLLGTEYPINKSLISDNTSIALIKDLLDELMRFLHYIKPLKSQGYEGEIDEAFYSDFLKYAHQIDLLIPLYNKVRNYLTQKPYSTEKFKLNFENSTLLDGWDKNKESDNSGIIFVKDNQFFLGIMDKKHNKSFKKKMECKSTSYYDKVNYKLLPGASKMLPKVFFGNSNIDYYKPNEEISKIRNHGTHTKNGQPQKGFEKLDFNIKDCRKIIDFFKESIQKHEDWSNFGFEFQNTANYHSIDEFYREVENQGYSITFEKIDEQYINDLVEEGKLFLFQIYNKDFSPYSKGKPNLHTLYWRALFSPENLKDVVYKLNGQAEVFFRKKTLNYSDETWAKGHHYEKLKDKFDYPIISKRRFAFDKFQFHVPITLNFKASGRDNINIKVLENLKEIPSEDIKFIGIDRGERHLLYLSLIDSKGKILEQFSLNEIINNYNRKKYTTNYHDLLQEKEKNRADSRTQWKTIETIKELKEGYISQVVHIVAKMMVAHNAILLMEDLNFGFKRGRFKVEKQVYQKFEKMLIEKLNYYIDKSKEATKIGGVLNALQLSSKFTSFKDMGKQSGFIFYIPAWNTSKIDPVTGFVNFFYTMYENVEKSQNFFAKFDSIRFNPFSHFFEFKISDYTAFNPKAEGTRQDWDVCTYGERILNFRNPEKNHQWDNKEINLTEAMMDFFNKNEIYFGNGHCFKAQIVAKDDKKFFEELYYLFRLTLQMRNSITNSEVDYLISPVCDKTGFFFDSRNQNTTQPKDADANGAYNIARKGILLLDKIKQAELSKKVDLRQTNKEWLNFVQNQN